MPRLLFVSASRSDCDATARSTCSFNATSNACGRSFSPAYAPCRPKARMPVIAISSTMRPTAEPSLSAVKEVHRPTTDAPVLVLGQTQCYVDAPASELLDDEGLASV